MTPSPEERADDCLPPTWEDDRWGIRWRIINAIRSAEQSAAERAREEEREACAKLAEEANPNPGNASIPANARYQAGCYIAATIRARGKADGRT